MKILSILSCVLLLTIGLLAPGCEKKEDALDKEQKSEVKVSVAEAQVVCNKFKLITKVTDSTLDLSVDTDLPDNTVVMVSVSRSYLEKSNPDKYCVDYFLEKSTIGKWKLKHRISIASEKWKTADISGLVEERSQMAKLLLQSFKYGERLQNNHRFLAQANSSLFLYSEVCITGISA